jgi:uncharacterized protein (TIRG00374 family)
MLFEGKPKFRKWITLSAVLGFVAFLAYLFFFTDFTQVTSVIGGTNVGIYAAAFLCVLVASAFDALAWKATIESLSMKTTFRRIFSLSWVGHFVDAIIPGGLAGDAFKTYLLTKDPDVNGAKAAASIIIKDVLELVVVLGSLVFGVVLLAFNYTVDSIIMTAIGITMVLLALPLVLLLYLSLNENASERLLGTIERLFARVKGTDANSSAFKEKVHHQIKDFRDGVLSIKDNPRAMVKPIVYQSFTWVFEVLSFFAVFVAINSFIGIDKVVITNTIVSNILGQGVALAGIGQIVASELYTVLGITVGVALASSVLSGFSNFWFKLVLSFAFFQVAVFERCVPFICNKCIGWTAWRTKSCPEPKPKKQRQWFWQKKQ